MTDKVINIQTGLLPIVRTNNEVSSGVKSWWFICSHSLSSQGLGWRWGKIFLSQDKTLQIFRQFESTWKKGSRCSETNKAEWKVKHSSKPRFFFFFFIAGVVFRKPLYYVGDLKAYHSKCTTLCMCVCVWPSWIPVPVSKKFVNTQTTFLSWFATRKLVVGYGKYLLRLCKSGCRSV